MEKNGEGRERGYNITSEVKTPKETQVRTT